MKTIIVYENGQVNEYELCYDQEYMDVCLEEYRRTFSLLRKGRTFVNVSESSKEYLRKIAGGIDDFVVINVSSCCDSNYLYINYIGAINPTVYNILSSKEGFKLDSSRIHALYAWYQAIKDNFSKDKRDLSLTNFDYYNLDEKIDLRTNISSLLSDVSLEYIGSVDTALDDDLIKARRNAIFIEEFSIRRNGVKKLKK